MSCPSCGHGFRIPDAGLQGIQRNFFVQKLLDLRHVITECSNTSLACDACSDDGTGGSEEAPPAFVHCVECKQKLCESCSKSHKRFTVSKHHHLVQLTHGTNLRELFRVFDQSLCDIHERDLIEMYCVDCKKFACGVCLASHSGHKCEAVETVGDEFRSRIETEIEMGSKGILASQDEIHKLENEDVASLKRFGTSTVRSRNPCRKS